MMAMILMAALAVPAAAQHQVPFQGTFLGNDTISPGPSPTTVLLSTNATGTGTHLGQFSFTQEFTLSGALNYTGSARWIAANGDIIYTTIVGSALPGDVVFTLTEVHTITGGTGRFSSARGSFNVHRSHVVTPNDDGTHVTFGWFEGSITPPGAGH
jgi:hypothetical protein